MTTRVPEPLRRFAWDIQSMVELADGEREILFIGKDLMGRLVATDDWLPEVFAHSDGAPFRQYRLYADAMERFCIVATVLAGGASLPLCQEPVWEICGVLRGAVTRRRYALVDGSAPQEKAAGLLEAGSVDTFSPKGGGGLAIVNGAPEDVAIIIQAYGAEIGTLERRTLAPDGAPGTFTTAYANPPEAPGYDILTIQADIAD